MTTDQKQDAAEIALHRHTVSNPKGYWESTGSHFADMKQGFLAGFDSGREYEAQQRPDLGAVREALAFKADIVKEWLEEAIRDAEHQDPGAGIRADYALADAFRGLLSLLTTRQSMDGWKRHRNEDGAEYWHHAKTGRVSLDAPQAAPAEGADDIITDEQMDAEDNDPVSDVYAKGYGDGYKARALLADAQAARAHPDGAEVEQDAQKAAEVYEMKRARWTGGIDHYPDNAVAYVEMMKAALSAMPTRDEGGLSAIIEKLEKVAPFLSGNVLLDTESHEMVSLRGIVLTSISELKAFQGNADGGLVDELAETCRLLLLSSEGQCSDDPDVLRARQNMARSVLARQKAQQAAGA